MKLVRFIVNYFKEVRAEVTKISWPTRAQTIRLTIIVLLVSTLIGALVGGLDFMFTNLLKLALNT